MVFYISGGHFVCKVFDLFTPFSVGLVYLMYRAFDELYVFKPVTSRPANSERYSKYKYPNTYRYFLSSRLMKIVDYEILSSCICATKCSELILAEIYDIHK